MIGSGYPELFLGHLINYTLLLILAERKFDLFQIVFIDETTGIEDFVVVGPKLRRVCPLNCVDKIALSCILLKSIRHRFIELGNESCADFLRASLTRCNNISNLDG